MRNILRSILNGFKTRWRYLTYLKKGGVLQVPVYVLPETKELYGTTCVVTGGAHGLGEVITKRLLSAGAEVIVIGRNKTKLDILQNSLKNECLHTFQWDLTDLSNIKQQLLRVADMSKNKCFHIWINNAAYVSGNGEMIANPMTTYDKTFDLNVKSLLFVGQTVCNYFKDNRIMGKMINISSLSSIQADIHPYYISKCAVNAITEGLAKKYIPYAINVNGIAPGYLPSGINYTNVDINAYREQSLAKRYVRLEEIAELVLFLVSGRGNSIVGQTIFCDGGDTLR